MDTEQYEPTVYLEQKVIGYKPKNKGFGISDWVKRRTSVTKRTWPFVAKAFSILPTLSKVSAVPILGTIFKWAMMFSPYDKRFTQGVTLPLNIDVTDLSEKVAVPIDLMKDAMHRTSYRLAMDRCLCRDAHDCQNYPHDIACIFTGKAARATAKLGLGREVTAEEACDLIDKAAAAGLIGQALWVEVEKFIWNVKNQDMENLLEFCFCCDCCCTALNISKNSSRDVQRRFKSSGWKAEISSDCVLCGKCAPVCPQKAIEYGDEKAMVSQECLGCGICKTKCPAGAINIVLKNELKTRVEDYFVGLNIDIES